MKQFLQIHNTDCNKRTIFRTFLQWENEKLKRRDAEAQRFYFEHGKHEGNGICTLRCLGLSRKLNTMTRKFNPENLFFNAETLRR